MNVKVNGIVAAMFGAGLLMGGPSASAQVVDGTPCESFPFEGLGNETCTQPNPFPGEGVLFTAAEQAISVASALADDVGCPVLSFNPITVRIAPNLNPGFPDANTTTLDGNAQYTTTEVINTEHYAGPFLHHGVRRHQTQLTVAGNILGGAFQQLTALAGTFVSDGPYSIMYGESDFTHSGSFYDEHVIKDFYQGIATAEETTDDNPSIATTRVIRDNGLEVTTKKGTVSNVTQTATSLESHPNGKWRQTSFYRGPNGGDGALTMTKVRIAPFGQPECLIQLSGAVTGSLSFPVFNGTLSAFPLQSAL